MNTCLYCSKELNLKRKKFCNTSCEDKHIDLEIDGKQHLYSERQMHDQEKDEYLANHNIIVYRIAWNDINTEKGRQMMHNKIDTFLNWYNNL